MILLIEIFNSKSIIFEDFFLNFPRETTLIIQSKAWCYIKDLFSLFFFIESENLIHLVFYH